MELSQCSVGHQVAKFAWTNNCQMTINKFLLLFTSNEKEHEHFTGHLKDTILRYVSQHPLILLYEFTILLIFKLHYVRVSKF